MDKYEHLIDEDLWYKLGLVERVNFEYSPLHETLSKVLKGNNKGNKIVKYDNDLL